MNGSVGGCDAVVRLSRSQRRIAPHGAARRSLEYAAGVAALLMSCDGPAAHDALLSHPHEQANMIGAEVARWNLQPSSGIGWTRPNRHE